MISESLALNTHIVQPLDQKYKFYVYSYKLLFYKGQQNDSDSNAILQEANQVPATDAKRSERQWIQSL